MPLGEDRDDTTIPVIALDDDKTHDKIQDVRRYPTRARRSAVGNQPYNTYAPRTTFLQLGDVQAHRSVLEASRLTQMTKEERLLATTTSPMEATIDDATHEIDSKLCTTSQEEMMVWAYMMTQYNLKPGLRKFSKGSDRGGEGADAASHYGYLDTAGGQQAIQRATNARTLITHVPQGKEHGRS